MRKLNLNILVIPVLILTFSCSGSDKADSSTSVDTNTLEEDGVLATENESVSTGDVDYVNLFNEVENTWQYNAFELAKTEDDLSIFVTLVERAGLESSLMVAEPVTAFIPTNEAFQQLPEKEFEKLSDPENKEQLIKLIRTHIMPAEVPSKHFTSSKVMETLSGERITVDVDQEGTVIKIGGADVIRSDVEVSNGIIHVMDAVLEPRDFAEEGID